MSKPTESQIDQAIQSYSLSELPAALPVIWDRLNLPMGLLQVPLERPPLKSGQDTPPMYHTKEHAHAVALHAYEGALWNQFDKKQTRAVVLAALFHDALHTQQASNYDDSNIERAVGTLRAHCADFKVNKLYTQEVIDEAVALVKGTKFPHSKVRPSEPLKVLRDADIMYGLYRSTLRLRVEASLGLFNERVGSYVHTEWSLFIEEQQRFLMTYQWYTSWAGRKAFRLNRPALLNAVVHAMKFNVVKDENGYRYPVAALI